MPNLRKSAVEQIRLEAKAEAFKLAAEFVDSPQFGLSPAGNIRQMARTSAQNLTEHIRLHGEYVAGP
jgi:hypothetical protein